MIGKKFENASLLQSYQQQSRLSIFDKKRLKDAEEKKRIRQNIKDMNQLFNNTGINKVDYFIENNNGTIEDYMDKEDVKNNLYKMSNITNKVCENGLVYTPVEEIGIKSSILENLGIIAENAMVKIGFNSNIKNLELQDNFEEIKGKSNVEFDKYDFFNRFSNIKTPMNHINDQNKVENKNCNTDKKGKMIANDKIKFNNNYSENYDDICEYTNQNVGCFDNYSRIKNNFLNNENDNKIKSFSEANSLLKIYQDKLPNELINQMDLNEEFISKFKNEKNKINLFHTKNNLSINESFNNKVIKENKHHDYLNLNFRFNKDDKNTNNNGLGKNSHYDDKDESKYIPDGSTIIENTIISNLDNSNDILNTFDVKDENDTTMLELSKIDNKQFDLEPNVNTSVNNKKSSFNYLNKKIEKNNSNNNSDFNFEDNNQISKLMGNNRNFKKHLNRKNLDFFSQLQMNESYNNKYNREANMINKKMDKLKGIYSDKK